MSLMLTWPAAAQSPDPFGEPETARPVPREPMTATEQKPYLSPMRGEGTSGGAQGVTREELPSSAALEERERGVERGELQPVMAADGSGLPYELWQGLTVEQLGQHIAALTLPPRSPVLHGLWRRLITSDVTPPSGTASPVQFTALRIEALDRSGLIDEAAQALANEPASTSDPLLSVLLARSEIGLGNRERGCEIARGNAARPTGLPKPMQAEALLINGYCAAVRGDTGAAELQAGLARELGFTQLAGPDLLDGVAAGVAPQVPAGTKLTLLDYRIAELKGSLANTDLIGAASPALLSALAHGPQTPPDLRLAAGEAAAEANTLTVAELAQLYRAPGAGGDGGSIERAGLFKSAESERTPQKKARLIRAYLDEALRAGLTWPAYALMAKPAAELQQAPEIGWFAETAVEIDLATGNYEGARSWARFGSTPGFSNPTERSGLGHWIALADITDPALTSGRTQSLGEIEALAHGGRIEPALLHRLLTVLDALELNVPIPLWDLANRAPQPSTGHLPDTGVLSELAEASKRREFGRTVLLVMRTLGPDGAGGAHMIALGDSIRALRRAGLEVEARQLALEGLFAAWPRTVSQ
jgi:hypothetical protein